MGINDGVLVYCETHPKIETGLTCSRCGKRICPKCMVQTAVGGRCVDCGKGKRSPTYDVSMKRYIFVGMLVLLAGIFWGIGWAFLHLTVGYIFLGLGYWILALLTGYIIGETTNIVSNRKKGSGLAIIATLGVIESSVVSLLVRSIFIDSQLSLQGVVLLVLLSGLASYIAVNRVR
ncbi:hypothetical protein FIM04_04580 [SAR202 cluster bacterium AC-409-J13_OGT_754m]|nr:hypothetical protein [SAR202 cluster bacterium AC-409-J13_OGT_754m]